MAIEIVSKPKIKKGLFSDIIFYFLLVLFLIFIFGYAFLYFSTKNLNREINNLNEKIKKNLAEESLEKKLKNTAEKINAAKSLLYSRRLSENVFSYLETNTLQKIQYKSFKLDVGKGTLDISGVTDSFNSVVQLLTVLKEKKDFAEKVENVETVINKKGEVEFRMTIFINSNVFNPVSEKSSLTEKN